MRLRRFALAVLGVNLFVILWGALVRATGSGAGCGSHWPLCNGEVIPQSPGTSTLIEYTHRATSGVAFLLVAALCVATWRAMPRGHRARTAALWSLIFMATEALVGAGLVLFDLVGRDDSMLRVGYLGVHLLNTFLLLGSLGLTALWLGEVPAWKEPLRGGASWLLAAGLLAVLVTGITGAVTALGNTLFPATSLSAGLRDDFSPTAHILVRLRVLHPVFALLTGGFLSAVVYGVTRFRPAAAEGPWGRRVTSVVLLQLVVGILNLLLHAPLGFQLTHLLVADVLWLALVVYAATALTAPRPGAAPGLSSPGR